MRMLLLDSRTGLSKTHEAFRYGIIDEEVYRFVNDSLVFNIQEYNIQTIPMLTPDMYNTLTNELVYQAYLNFLQHVIEQTHSDKVSDLMYVVMSKLDISQHMRLRLYLKDTLTKHFYMNDEIEYVLDNCFKSCIAYILNRVSVYNSQVVIHAIISLIEEVTQQLNTVKINYIHSVEMFKDRLVIIYDPIK